MFSVVVLYSIDVQHVLRKRISATLYIFLFFKIPTLKLEFPTLILEFPTLILEIPTLKLIFPTLKLEFPTLILGFNLTYLLIVLDYHAHTTVYLCVNWKFFVENCRIDYCLHIITFLNVFQYYASLCLILLILLFIEDFLRFILYEYDTIKQPFIHIYIYWLWHTGSYCFHGIQKIK